METIGQYTITNNNGTHRQKASVRVRRNGAVVAVVYSDDSYNPLKQILENPDSSVRRSFVSQLKKADVPPEDIDMMLRHRPATRYETDGDKLKRLQARLERTQKDLEEAKKQQENNLK